MMLNRLWSSLPPRRAILTVVFPTMAGAATMLAVLAWTGRTDKLSPAVGPTHDPRFVSLGQNYLPHLGKAYAAAWEEGAKALEAGASISTALDTVAKSWSSNRTEIYDRVVTPQLSLIIEESVDEAKVTASDRAAMAAAWRGLAKGLAK
jgi:hypothetical protein